MNTDLLRLARKHRGVRSWAVPGFGNPAQLIPSKHAFRGFGATFRWPGYRDYTDGHGGSARELVVFAVDLNRHLVMARRAARELLR